MSEIVGIASRSLASLLEDYAAYTFDTEAMPAAAARDGFTAWSQHVLSGEPVAGHSHPEGASRDFDGLRQAFLAHRRAENEHLADLERRLGTIFELLAEALMMARPTYIDPLTDIYARRAFDEHASRIVDACNARGIELSVLLFQLDGPVTDADRRRFARDLQLFFPRRCEFVVRYDLECFCLLAFGDGLAGTKEKARAFLDRMRAANLPASIGAAAHRRRDGLPRTIQRAEEALRRAAETGDRVETAE